MTRLLFATTMAFALAACSTTGTTTQETRAQTNTSYAFKTDIDGSKGKLQNKDDEIKVEPRLGFAGFSGSQTRWGAN